MDLKTFQTLATADITQIVREKGPKVIVFPINGTRRWFILEHGPQAENNFIDAYMTTTWNRQIELYKLFFEHGVDTLLTPIFGPELLGRGEEYAQMIKPGLLWVNENQALLDFYKAYDVRVRIYGDTRRYLTGSVYEDVLDSFEALAQKTAAHQSHRLFFGVCAHDPAESVAEIGLNFHQEHGRLPDKKEIVTAYYGEPLDPVDIFIGFDRPSAFDMPLIATGSEDLYFTVSPSPYLDQQTLRAILHDHIYSRRVSESYNTLSAESWKILAEFYTLNRHHVLGMGKRSADGSFWYPLPQVFLPAELNQETT